MKVFVVIGVFVFVICTIVAAETQNSCNCERTKNGSGIFLVCRNVVKNATDAQDYCSTNCSSTLGSIKSFEEFQELVDFIGTVPNCKRFGGKSPNAFYIGAQDVKTEGDWRWIDDNSLLNQTYSNWSRPSLLDPNVSTCRDQPGQQNVCTGEEPANQDYVVMQMCDGNNYGAWFDVIGERLRPFICKIGFVSRSSKTLSVIPRYERTSQESTRVTTAAATITTTEVEELNFNTTVTREDDSVPSTTSISRTTRYYTTAADYETTPTESIVVKSASSSTTNATPPSPRQTETLDESHIASAKSTGAKDDDYLRQLYCIMLSMLKQSHEVLSLLRNNSCKRVNRGDDWNPILYFEDTASKAAAKIFFSRSLNASFSNKVGGMRLEIIPIRSKAAGGDSIQSFKMPIEDSCVECDEIEIDHSDTYEVDKVIVGARFESSVLEGLGVYDSPLETTLDKSDLEYTSYVSPGTSVLSVTLFKNTKAEGVHAMSKPTKINFNLDKDDSLGDIVMSGVRSRLSKLKRKCVFMKPDGKWSDLGCVASSEKATFSVQCNCNHTTAFAVMVSLDAIKIPDWLETVLVIVEIIGIIFLLSTLAMLLYLRQTLKKGRIITQLHLCLALLLMHISMVCAYYATPIDGLCVTLAAFSHFFMVSSAMWMLNEGIVLYKKTGSGALNFDIHKFKKWLILLGWVVPFLYAVICLAIGMSVGVYLDTTIEHDDLKSRNLLDRTTKDVMKYKMCWLGTKNYMVIAAIAPVAITLLLATCILLWVTKIIWGMSKQALDMMPSGVKKNRESIKSTARAVALLIPVLGLPWILAFLVNIEGAEVVFTAINGITNGLQGFVLFIIYIIINRETRTSMKRKLTRSFSSSQAHSLSALSSGVSHKSRDSVSHDGNGGGNKPPSRQKEASAIAKV